MNRGICFIDIVIFVAVVDRLGSSLHFRNVLDVAPFLGELQDLEDEVEIPVGGVGTKTFCLVRDEAGQ